MKEKSNQTDGREVLKRRLADGEFKSSIDRILDAVGRSVQKLTRRTSPPASWVSALAIALLICLIALLLSLLTGGVSRYGYRTIALGGGLIFLNLVIARSAFSRAYATLRDKLLDGLESSAGLTGLESWLTATAVIKWPALLGLLIYAFYVIFILPNPIEAPSPVETVVVGGVMLLWTGFLLYYMVLFAILPLRLSRCQFKLYAEDPASSEVLQHWSSMMNYAAYMFAFMLAAGTLFTVTAATFTMRTLMFIVPRWLPLIALFVVNQMAVSGVITRSKRKSLKGVEAQIAVLRARETLPGHETRETLLWLWDYHDRIKDTRGSALDVKGIMNLVSTLLIPTLAFLVANRQAISELLGWLP